MAANICKYHQSLHFLTPQRKQLEYWKWGLSESAQHKEDTYGHLTMIGKIFEFTETSLDCAMTVTPRHT